MLDLAHGIPADWTEEALTKAGFDAKAYDHTPGASNQKSFFRKMGAHPGHCSQFDGHFGLDVERFPFS
jgi:hypothetical protein